MSLGRICAPFAIVMASTAGCSDAPVMRVVHLEPQEPPAVMAAEEADGSLAITFDPVEPLANGHRHVAWATTATAFVALGEVHPDEALVTPLDSVGLMPGETEEVRVTVEEDGETLPTEPSPEVVVRGPVGGPFEIRSGFVDSIALASGTATLEDESLELHAEGLPSLPGAYFYGVWLTFGEGVEPAEGHADDGHDHMHEEEPADEHDALFAGRLSGEMLHSMHARLLATASDVVVTLEYDEGAVSRSPTTILHGSIEVPAPSEDTQGGHMH